MSPRRSGDAPDSPEPLLRVDGVTVRFGGLTALSSVSMNVERNAIVGVIGPNGAGKSTLFNAISGVHPPSSGAIIVNGQDVTGLSPHQVASKGLARTFQNSLVFGGMSVVDNVRVAITQVEARPSLLRAIFGGLRDGTSQSRINSGVSEILNLVRLSHLGAKLCNEISHGQRRLVSIAIALATRPILLLLDEPLAGLTKPEVADMLALFRTLRERSMTILLVEHNVGAVMDVCDRVVVLEFGEIIANDLASNIPSIDAVIKAYLGRPGNESGGDEGPPLVASSH